MSAAHGIAVAVIFVWLGMVVAISFMEAPLKFRAPGVSLQVGLGIGRLVFRALNTAEVALAVPLLIASAADPSSLVAAVAVGVVVAALATQLTVRPMLSRRSDAVLAASVPAFTAPAGSARRSRTHYGYVALELVKIVALIVGGVALLAA
jgi:hypothetical protein